MAWITRRATPDDRPASERLRLMCRRDMSEFAGQLPNPDETLRKEGLEAVFADGVVGWGPYLFSRG